MFIYRADRRLVCFGGLVSYRTLNDGIGDQYLRRSGWSQYPARMARLRSWRAIPIHVLLDQPQDCLGLVPLRQHLQLIRESAVAPVELR
jgi:hypothetical protein